MERRGARLLACVIAALFLASAAFANSRLVTFDFKDWQSNPNRSIKSEGSTGPVPITNPAGVNALDSDVMSSLEPVYSTVRHRFAITPSAPIETYSEIWVDWWGSSTANCNRCVGLSITDGGDSLAGDGYGNKEFHYYTSNPAKLQAILSGAIRFEAFATRDGGGPTIYTDYVNVTINTNRKPVVSNASISPSQAYYGDAVTAAYSWSDADGDADQSTVKWWKNGIFLASAKAVQPTMFTTGDVLTVEVTPFDGFEEGQKLNASTTIVNFAPNATSVTDKTKVQGGATTTWNVTAYDREPWQAMTLTGSLGNPDGPNMCTGTLSAQGGQSSSLSCSVSIPASDGPQVMHFKLTDGSATTAFNDEFEVDSTPPSTGSVFVPGLTNMTKPTISLSSSGADFYKLACSEAALANAPLKPFAATVTDFDVTGPGCPAGDGVRTLFAEFSDAAGNAQPVRASANTTLDTTPPEATAAPQGIVLPGTTVTVTVKDPLDARPFVRTCADDSNTCTPNSTSTALPLQKRGQNFVRVLAIDSAGNSKTFSFPVRVNSPPVIDSVEVDNSLTCVAAGSDPDAQAVSFAYAWFADGAFAGSAKRLAEARPGSLVACQATPTDGLEEGLPSNSSARSVPLVIEPPAPEQPEPEAQPPRSDAEDSEGNDTTRPENPGFSQPAEGFESPEPAPREAADITGLVALAANNWLALLAVSCVLGLFLARQKLAQAAPAPVQAASTPARATPKPEPKSVAPKLESPVPKGFNIDLGGSDFVKPAPPGNRRAGAGALESFAALEKPEFPSVETERADAFKQLAARLQEKDGRFHAAGIWREIEKDYRPIDASRRIYVEKDIGEWLRSDPSVKFVSREGKKKLYRFETGDT